MIKLLIVDDIEKNLYMMQALLQGHGYEVVTAEDGAKALETARHDPPDMIISDILMPVMDGFSLCRKWKKDEELKHIPFVFYTATYTDPKDEEFALSLGAERFLVKPLKPNVLVEMLQEIIDEHQAGQLSAPQEPVEEETIFLREYNEALIRKLEDKLLLLVEANQTLRFEIEERKQAEEALETSERKFRGIANNIPGMVFQLLFRSDGSTYFSYANPLAGELFGFPDDLESKDWDFGAHTHPDDREEFLTSINQAVENFTNWNYEGRTLLPDGEVKWFEGIASPARVDDVVIFDGVLLDITRRKRAEETLRESEEKGRQFFDKAPTYCYMISPEGVVLDINKAALKALGYKKGELVGKPLKTIYAPESQRKAKQLFAKWKKEGQLDEEEMVILTNKGERRTVLFGADAVRDKDGKILYSISVQRDITARKKAEEDLSKHQEHLEELVGERTTELQREIEERKQVEQELRVRTEELEVFNKAMVDREMRVIELKEKINGLCEELGKEPMYPPVW
jgi:PAS domain S-box-containing protein